MTLTLARVAAWGTLLARLFVRRPQAAVHAVASAAAAEEGVAFLFSHPSLTVAEISALNYS